MKQSGHGDDFDKYYDELEKGLIEVQNTEDKKSAIENFNTLANTFNSIVQSSSNLLSNAQGIFALQAEIVKINSETAVKLAEMQKSFSEFMVKEENKKEVLIKILETLKEQNNKILDKAIAVDLAKCTDREYEFVMKTMDDTQRHLDRIMDTFDKFITSR